MRTDNPILLPYFGIPVDHGSLSQVGLAAQWKVAFFCGFVVAPWFVRIYLTPGGAPFVPHG